MPEASLARRVRTGTSVPVSYMPGMVQVQAQSLGPHEAAHGGTQTSLYDLPQEVLSPGQAGGAREESPQGL